MSMIATPIIPQTKIGFVGQSTPRIPPSLGGTVAIPLTHDWGPLGSEMATMLDAKKLPLTQFAEWTDNFGDGDTEGRTAVALAFEGAGILGEGGAGGVIPWRMGTGAARAVATVQHTGNVNALRLTAKWAGTRGNDYSFALDDDPSDVTRDRLRIFFKGALIETYLYPATDVDALVAAINLRDAGNITAVSLVTGTALKATAGTALSATTAGTNGAALTGGDYTAALAGLEFRPFTLLAPANLTDGAVRASILSWVQTQADENRPVVFVEGGLGNETIDDAITRSVATADPHVVNLGVGTYHDDLLGKDLNTAELAPRIAGVLAARGTKRALTGAELGGLHIVGSTVLIRTDSPDAELRVAKGLTTFTDDGDEARPRRIFEEPRFIRIMDLFVRELRQWGDRTIVGNRPVNQDTRDAVRQKASQMIDALLGDGVIITKAQGAEDDPFVRTPVTTDDTLPFEFGWQFAYTANFLIGNGRVR
jgi:hypothetical protein